MVYLDYAATTPYNKDVLKTYTQLLEKYFYNADSIYSQGIEVNRLLEKSRGLLAKMLDVDEEEMIFTSCGSEANNMAIKGIAFQYQNRGKHIITTSIEHSSVYETCKELEEVFTNNESVEHVICEGVTVFRGLTFGNCSNLRQVILGENVQELVGIGTFTNCCQLMELHFTDALTSIDDEENFYGCDNLTIYGPADSYIESFAKEYGIPFVVE